MNNQQHEIRTTINHLTENTKSYQLIKSVLDESSKAVYQGKIFVNSDAQKTDGYQLKVCIKTLNLRVKNETYIKRKICCDGISGSSKI